MKIENIKFKAKSILDGAWVQGDLIHKEDGKIAILRNGFNVSEVYPSTVCQFTGLKDCKGKEIWEGDIVERDIYAPYRGFVKAKAVIEYSVGAFVAMVNIAPYPLYSQDIKVVGNKFDKEK